MLVQNFTSKFSTNTAKLNNNHNSITSQTIAESKANIQSNIPTSMSYYPLINNSDKSKLIAFKGINPEPEVHEIINSLRTSGVILNEQQVRKLDSYFDHIPFIKKAVYTEPAFIPKLMDFFTDFEEAYLKNKGVDIKAYKTGIYTNDQKMLALRQQMKEWIASNFETINSIFPVFDNNYNRYLDNNHLKVIAKYFADQDNYDFRSIFENFSGSGQPLKPGKKPEEMRTILDRIYNLDQAHSELLNNPSQQYRLWNELPQDIIDPNWVKKQFPVIKEISDMNLGSMQRELFERYLGDINFHSLIELIKNKNMTPEESALPVNSFQSQIKRFLDNIPEFENIFFDQALDKFNKAVSSKKPGPIAEFVNAKENHELVNTLIKMIGREPSVVSLENADIIAKNSDKIHKALIEVGTYIKYNDLMPIISKSSAVRNMVIGEIQEDDLIQHYCKRFGIPVPEMNLSTRKELLNNIKETNKLLENLSPDFKLNFIDYLLEKDGNNKKLVESLFNKFKISANFENNSLVDSQRALFRKLLTIWSDIQKGIIPDSIMKSPLKEYIKNIVSQEALTKLLKESLEQI